MSICKYRINYAIVEQKSTIFLLSYYIWVLSHVSILSVCLYLGGLSFYGCLIIDGVMLLSVIPTQLLLVYKLIFFVTVLY